MPGPLTPRGVGSPDFVTDLRQLIYTVSSNKDTHFTEYLAKNSVERENLTGLRSNRIRISHITIQSTQQLLFQLILYGTDAFDESDLADDRYVADVELDMPHYSLQQTTSQYRMDLDVDINYEDIDETNELHIVLKNLSPTAKSIYPTTEIKIDFHCESRA